MTRRLLLSFAALTAAACGPPVSPAPVVSASASAVRATTAPVVPLEAKCCSTGGFPGAMLGWSCSESSLHEKLTAKAREQGLGPVSAITCVDDAGSCNQLNEAPPGQLVSCRGVAAILGDGGEEPGR